MEKDSIATERRYNVVKASATLMRDKPEEGAALLRWLKQKRVLDARQPTVVDGTSTTTNRVALDHVPEDLLPSMWRDCFAMPPDHSSFEAPHPRTRITYEHNLIKPIPHIEQGDIFDDSDDEIIRVEHDVLDEDYEEPLHVAHKGSAGSTIKRPTVADIEEGFILGRDRTFDVMMDQVNEETTSSLTNMRILDHVNAKVVYDLLQGPQRGIVSPLTLRPMAYYEAESDQNVSFEEASARTKFMEVWEKWPVGTTREEKLEDFLKNIVLWDTVDGQHIAYACKVLAKDAVKKRKLDIESMKLIFTKRLALVVVYDDPTLYLEASKKQNNFFKPDRKKHARVWQTLWKLRDVWDTLERPRANVEADNEKRAKVLACFANILDINLPAGEEIKIRKLTDKLADWTAHVCREDDDAFNNILNIRKGFDEGFLHADVEKERQWKKYEQEKLTNLDAVPPRRGEMTMNWLKPLRGLRDEDYKELSRLVVYDHVSDRQRVYFADVDKPNPRPGTLKFISYSVRSRQAVRNAFCWLKVEGNIQSTTMEEFLKKDVSRFGNHQILSWLKKMGTRRFV